MNSPFKFLRRVRIHGGECDAVARALHHEVKGSSLYQADSGKALGSTNERKSMSTKTSTLKRIAQTAVVALLGGLMSVVAAPSSNALIGTSLTATCVARDGVGGVIKVNVTGDNTAIVYAVQSASTPIAGVAANAAAVALQTNVISATPDTSAASTIIQLAPDSITSSHASVTYTVWLDNLQNGSGSSAPNGPSGAIAGDPNTTVVCTNAGVPAKFSLSATSASVAASESTTFTITPQDAAGNTTLLKATETMTVTSSATAGAIVTSGVENTNATTGARLGIYRVGGNLPFTNVSAGGLVLLRNTASTTCTTATATVPCSISLGNGHADGGSAGVAAQTGRAGASETITATGAYTVNVTNTAAASTTFTVDMAGTLIGATDATFTLTTQDFAFGSAYGVGSAAAAGTYNTAAGAVAGYGVIASNQKAGYNAPSKSLGSANSGTTTDSTYYVSTGKTSVTLTWQLSAAAGTMPYTVAAVSTTSSTPSGITTGTFNQVAVTGETITSVTFTATAPVSGQNFKVSWKATAAQTVTATFQWADPVVNSSNGSVTLNPASAGKALASSTVTTIGTVKDQFNSPVSGATVLWSQTGRNATTASVALTTNADGESSYAFTDDATPATTLTETISASAATSGSGSYTAASSVAYTWVTALTAGSIRVINDGDTTDGTAVDTGVLFTATVLDASGLALSGYPVVFTGDAGTFYSTTANTVTAYTTAAGVATATFKGKTAGTGTVTVSSGGKSATSDFDIIAGGSRTVALDATTATMTPDESKRITATVKDRYGNAVEDASVTVSYTGTSGRVVSLNGVAASTGTTDASGKVVIELSGTSAGTGTLTVTITAGDASTAAKTGSGAAMPEKVTSATAAITISGTSAGITASQAATAAAEAASDAAAEAIDAANAATDAANLAAEAADAATVAAEEARDAADAATAAVEELATQVATLMAALKAQITTLANTVAKIAKKVKA